MGGSLALGKQLCSSGLFAAWLSAVKLQRSRPALPMEGKVTFAAHGSFA